MHTHHSVAVFSFRFLVVVVAAICNLTNVKTNVRAHSNKYLAIWGAEQGKSLVLILSFFFLLLFNEANFLKVSDKMELKYLQ